MSMNDSIIYDLYKVDDVKPDWVKSERYEYCEDFYNSIRQKEKEAFKSFVMSLRSFLF